jgi:hypothetical protein
VVLLCLSSLAQAGNVYTDDMFRTGLEERSTSPLFVLITLRNARTGEDREACIPGPFLLGAIHRERRLPYDARGSAEALSIALSQHDRVFTFKRLDALRNVQPRYTPALLAEVRNKLSGGTVRELLAGQNYDGGMRDAIAHVLLERGTLVGITDMGGNLYVYESHMSLSEWLLRRKPDTQGGVSP